MRKRSTCPVLPADFPRRGQGAARTGRRGTDMKGPDMSETPEAGERRHSEVPAEGDPDADASEIRVHTQDPAEGPDSDD